MSDGVVRVFVSSTFRDMRRERDVMMGSVFPQVRRWCEQRGVIWREIHLRWGITMEEANRGETLLEELRMFGSFEELPNRVSKALCANSAKELYGQMLTRLESGCGPSRVRDLFSFMQISRRGLTESELAILLGSGTMPLPSAYLWPLLLAAREALICTRGRLRSERAELRDAVAARYLAGGDKAWRERLVEHFTKEPWSRRKVEELPWQLAALAS
jgi:hypothetical protein